MEQNYRQVFEGRRITVMGLGLLGRGVGDAEFLARCGAKVLITDLKTEEQLAESVAKLKKYSNVTFRLGEHRVEDFVCADMVIKAAGVPLDSPYIASARKAGVPVYMSTALFAKFAMEAGVKVVGVTGTRGKSTVTQMINYALIRTNKPIVLGGNVRGKSTLAMLPQLVEGSPLTSIAVLELDSWQLQGFGDLEISPHIAVFTNLMPDHQNYYPSMDAYFNDKANIFRFQRESDALIVGDALLSRIPTAHTPCEPLVPPAIPADWKLKVIGEHNRENASLAAAALRALGLREDEIRTGLESFQPVEGRLQFVREIGGVKIYNDNNATTPEATIAALRALDNGQRNIVLIMGGSDKGLDMNALVKEMYLRCKSLVLLSGTGSERIQKDFPQPRLFDGIKSALDAALTEAKAGDSILFSPAFASFGMFRNEYDRNDQFMDVVRKL